MADTKALAEKQRQTAQDFVDGQNAFTVEGVLARRGPNCLHHVRPASLNQPPQTNEQYEASYRKMMPLVSNYKMEVLKMINDPVARTVVLLATGKADSAVGRYENEYTFFLEMSEDGEQLVAVTEMLDTKFVTDFIPRLLTHHNMMG